MDSVIHLKSASRVFDPDTKRGWGQNKPRQHKLRNHNFQIREDESERQLLQEQRYAEEQKFLAMASPTPSDGTTAGEALTLPRTAMEALRSSLTSGKFSDLTVTHGKHAWSAHRVVVCSQMPELESMIVSFGDRNTLGLEAYDYDAVCALMEYLYNSNYNLPADVHPNVALRVHMAVFNLSVEISASALEILSLQKFRYILNRHINDPLTFFAAVRAAYANPHAKLNHAGIRVALVEAGAFEYRKLIQGTHRTDLFKLTAEVPQFQQDLVLMLLEHPDRPMEAIASDLCDDCGPREDGVDYTVIIRCIGCGKDKRMCFL